MTICTPWRVAASENVLLEQVNALWPSRSKASDGSIGDTAHQAEQCDSQHNSCCIRLNGVWIIRARDFTHDPASGADMHKIWVAIIASRDNRVRYMIFNRQIVYPTARNGYGAWVPQPYHGSDPHTNHLHLSVLDDPAKFDNTRAWAIGGATPPGVKPATGAVMSYIRINKPDAEGGGIYFVGPAGPVHVLKTEWDASGFDKNPPAVLTLNGGAERLEEFKPPTVAPPSGSADVADVTVPVSGSVTVHFSGEATK